MGLSILTKFKFFDTINTSLKRLNELRPQIFEGAFFIAIPFLPVAILPLLARRLGSSPFPKHIRVGGAQVLRSFYF